MSTHLQEWPCSTSFLSRLQQRSDALATEPERLAALESALPHVPLRGRPAFAHYCLLTIAGLYGNRRTRWRLAQRLAQQDSRPERFATFLITKLRHYKNKIAQIAVALRDPQAVENAIRQGW